MDDEDLKLAVHLVEKFGPFDAWILVDSTKADGLAARCDICSQTCTKYVVAKSKVKMEFLNLCIGECGQVILGRVEYKKVMDSILHAESGLSPAGEETRELAIEELEADRKFAETVTHMMAHDEVEAVVTQAKKYRTAGFGKNWKIIPSLFDQWDRKRRLSLKQVEVLRKFNRSCNAEVRFGK